jgi:hypothetical protein
MPAESSPWQQGRPGQGSAAELIHGVWARAPSFVANASSIFTWPARVPAPPGRRGRAAVVWDGRACSGVPSCGGVSNVRAAGARGTTWGAGGAAAQGPACSASVGGAAALLDGGVQSGELCPRGPAREERWIFLFKPMDSL